jgi:lipopolysaccharide transport system ATP-binding protein
MRGRVGALIALGAGFNPILTGRENIYINGSVLGLTKKEIDEKIDEIIDFAEIREAIDMPVQNYSSGMTVRLGFAVATTLDPDVLILDEVLAVGDAAFRAKCYARISEIAAKAAIIFVSHNMEQITQVCSKGILIESGTVQYYGDSVQAADMYSNLASRDHGLPEINEHLSQKVRLKNLDISSCIDYGGDISVQLEIFLEKEVKNVDLHISLSDKSRQVVSRVYTKLSKSSFDLHSGLNIIKANVGPNYLNKGKYTISIALLDRLTSEQLYWGNHIKQISVSGPSNPSGACAPPIKIKVS